MLYQSIFTIDVAIAHIITFVNIIFYFDIHRTQTVVIEFNCQIQKISSFFCVKLRQLYIFTY